MINMGPERTNPCSHRVGDFMLGNEPSIENWHPSDGPECQQERKTQCGIASVVDKINDGVSKK